MLAVKLPPDIEERLDNLAKLTGRSKSFYARAAIVEYLDDMEDAYLAEKRLDDVRRGEATTIPLQELIDRYGLEN